MNTGKPVFNRFSRPLLLSMIFGICVLLGHSQTANAQQFGNADRARGRRILGYVRDELKDKYYDPTFHGIDMNTVFAKAAELMDQAKSNNDMWSVIAQCLMLLNDSHTRFYPPLRLVDTDYGWDMQMIGDKCFVVNVEKGSDAETKKLAVGDEVLNIEGYVPTRDNLKTIQYLYDSLRPQSGLRIVVRSPGGDRRDLTLMARVTEGKRFRNYSIFDNEEAKQKYRDYIKRTRDLFHEIGTDAIVWKLQQFRDDDEQVDAAMHRVRKFKTLVLDLRSDRGGYIDTLKRVLGYFVESEIKIGEIHRRKGTEPFAVKSRGNDIFKGKLVVLVDSLSASASELFARTIQIQKRGTVIGDKTSGAVMQSRLYDSGRELFYSMSITDADIVMSDGKRLEHVGVAPDVLVIPSGSDLASHRDPVLALALSQVGVTVTPDEAGTFFPADDSERH